MLGSQIKVVSPKLPKAFVGDCVAIEDGRLRQVQVNLLDLAESSLDELTIEECKIAKLAGLGCQFERFLLFDTIVSEGDLAGFAAIQSRFERCSITNIRLTGAQLAESEWSHVLLNDCKGDLLNLRFAILKNVRFEDVNFKQVDFSSADFSNVVFDDCDLEGAIFRNGRMQNTYFRNCNLVDIEGASGLAGSTIEESQLIMLGPSLARELQINVQAMTEP